MKIISILLKITGVMIFTGIFYNGIQKYRLFSILTDQIRGIIFYFITSFLIFIFYFYSGIKSKKLSLGNSILLRHKIGASIILSVPWLLIVVGFFIAKYADGGHGLPSLGIFAIFIPIVSIIYLITGIIILYMPYDNE